MKNRSPWEDSGSTIAGLVEVNGLEPSASTLRIQTGRSCDLGLYEKPQLNRHFR